MVPQITGPSDTSDVRRVPVRPLKLEDAMRPPTNLYTPTAPHTATVLSVRNINSGHPTDQAIYEVVFDHRGFLSYWEGQAFDIMRSNPNNPFLPWNAKENPDDQERTTIFAASTRYGDYVNGRTATIVVPPKQDDKTLKYLCMEARPGDHIQLVRPFFEAILLGDYSPTATHIFVAESGAAIAPFRAHLRRFFKEDIPTFKFSGDVWLFYGERNNLKCRLYDEEFMQYEEDYPRNFHYNFFVDILDLREKIFELLVHSGAYIYLVGSGDMVRKVEDNFGKVANNWDEIKRKLVRKNQWRVQLYNKMNSHS